MKNNNELEKIKAITHIPLNYKKIKSVKTNPVSLNSVKYESSLFHNTECYVVFGSEKPISKIIDLKHELNNEKK